MYQICAVLTSSVWSYLTGGRGESYKTLHTRRKADFTAVPLRFPNSSSSGSRSDHRTLVFGGHEAVPSLGKDALLPRCSAGEMPRHGDSRVLGTGMAASSALGLPWAQGRWASRPRGQPARSILAKASAAGFPPCSL